MTRPRVLLADDHPIVVEGLKGLLSDEFDLVGVVEDGHALVSAARKLQPDVVIADISMPHLNGIDAFLQLKKELPRVKVVFLTMHRDVAYARRALEAGASGYVIKHSAPSELVTAIRAALKDTVYITPTMTGDVLEAIRRGPQNEDEPGAALTPRQREVLQLLAEGLSAKEIAGALSISARTVEFHKYHIMESLGLHNSAELILYSVKHRLVTI